MPLRVRVEGIIVDKSLSTNENLLYNLIEGLCTEKGYTALSNRQLSKKTGFSIRSISRHVSKLKDRGLITTEEQRIGTAGTIRKIYLSKQWKNYSLFYSCLHCLVVLPLKI